MARVEYVLPLGENARKRHSNETVRGTVIAFVVQLEVFVDGKWWAVLQFEGDEAFNAWATELAQCQREQGQAVVYVHVKGLKPAHSRLEEPVIQGIV